MNDHTKVDIPNNDMQYRLGHLYTCIKDNSHENEVNMYFSGKKTNANLDDLLGDICAYQQTRPLQSVYFPLREIRYIQSRELGVINSRQTYLL